VNPEIPDDGRTEGNVLYNNTISNSEAGIGATRTQDNILENNKFFDIESSKYRLSGSSRMTIKGQEFDNAVISAGSGPTLGNIVEIVDSGTVQVTEGASEEDDSEDEDSGESYNTDIEPYRRTLNDGDDITVNSSS
jgi:parallel beta-helix repeat protein